MPHACAGEGSGLAAAASSGMKCALLGLAKSPSKKGAGEWPRSEREEDQPAGARSPSRCLPSMLRKVRLASALRAGSAEGGNPHQRLLSPAALQLGIGALRGSLSGLGLGEEGRPPNLLFTRATQAWAEERSV